MVITNNYNTDLLTLINQRTEYYSDTDHIIRKCKIKDPLINSVLYDGVYDATKIGVDKWFIIDIKTGQYLYGKNFSSDELIFINMINDIVDEL